MYGDGPSCGTARKYRQGCRCDPCRDGANRRQREYQARYKAKHGASYRTRYPAPPYEGYTDRLRQRDAARRARKAGATVESFTHAEVYERDAWTCGICTEVVDSAKAWPDPLSASLDHVIPLSLDGEHSRANTRLAHLVCNQRRGAAREGQGEVTAPRPA